MKRVSMVVVAFLAVTLLASCSGKAATLVSKIDTLGEVTADSREQLNKLEEEYEELDDAQKGKVGNYNKLADAIDQCDKLNNEQAFLSDMESSITNRMSHKDDSHEDLVNGELGYLEKYKDLPFSDQRLSELRDNYIDGLAVQKQSLSEGDESDEQIAWQRGLVERYGALKQLNEEYGFLADNKDFVPDYVLGFDRQKALLDAFDAIEADLESQTVAQDCDWSDCSVKFEVANNTDYQFSSMWECRLKNEAGTVTESANCLVEDIKPHSVYTITFYYANPESGAGGFDWNNYYTDVVI